MTVRVVATAGHVDHGKSTLVLALTGIDPDRLEEEKRRGLTIELGFARFVTPTGVEVHLIDVPGHIRFIKTMLAGVGAVDACLLVVAATEGWKPQTEEHLRILQLLGVRHGLVVVTMADRVDADGLELVLLEVAEHTAGTFLEGAEMVVVSAPSGLGLTALRDAIDRLVTTVPVREDQSRPRLWVDRSFSLPGAGTIVTGTLAGGAVAIDDAVEIATSGGLRSARIRSLHSFGTAQPMLQPGCRAALNLAGLSHREVRRGDAVVHPGQWHRTREVDASLTTLTTVAKPVRNGGAYIAYVGSGEHAVRLRLLGSDHELPAGAEGMVRLWWSAGLPLIPGDRFVLRDSGSGTTVGGGEILDVAPTLAPSRARPDRSIDRLIAERGWIDIDDLYRLTGVRRPPVVGRWAVDPELLSRSERELQSQVEAAGPAGVDISVLDERQRALVAADEELAVAAGRVLPATSADPFTSHPYLDLLNASPFDPPSPSEADVSDEDQRELLRRRLVVKEDGIVFPTTAVEQASAVAARLLEASPSGISVSDLRTALGTSRRFALALLAMMDRNGVTRRRGDLRVAGPRLLRHSA